MDTKDYCKIFQEAFSITQNQEASLEILKQVAIDNRQKNTPITTTQVKLASEKQKAFLDRLNVGYDEKLSSSEANELIKKFKK